MVSHDPVLIDRVVVVIARNLILIFRLKTGTRKEKDTINNIIKKTEEKKIINLNSYCSTI